MLASSQDGVRVLRSATKAVLLIKNVVLPTAPDDSTTKRRYNVVCRDGKIERIVECTETASSSSAKGKHQELGEHFDEVVDANGGILLPGLCHAHIHLDKCFLLNCDELRTGDFAEALEVTAKAKAAFPSDLADLYGRGRRLIIESVQCGVTAMRAHVEVDKTVRMACVDTGLKLKQDFHSVCDMQICVFAQDPLFDSTGDADPGENYTLLQAAATRAGVQAVGAAPYVEPSAAHAKANIGLVLDTAHAHGLHADFHLDYNLDPAAEPLIWHLLVALRERKHAGRWADGARVCVGHATRLSLFSAEEWARFRGAVAADDLPITLVGLPPSDMYMMGRGAQGAPRATLNAPGLARAHGVRVAMAVNNVENAFTPQGTLDPLALCPLGVAVFQDGTRAGCRILLEAVTITARNAIAARSAAGLVLAEGDAADVVLLHENDSLYAAALSPSYTRTVIKDGEVVATRRAGKWIRLGVRDGI